MNEIGLQMGLSRPENDKIFNDALTTNKEHQLLGVGTHLAFRFRSHGKLHVLITKHMLMLEMKTIYDLYLPYV